MDKQAKKVGKGILGIGILLVMLVMATGSASADYACVADDGTGAFFCGDTVTENCTLNGTMDCSGFGLNLSSGTNHITINGYNATDNAYYAIKGSKSANACSCDDEDAPENADCGIYNDEHDNVTIKNLTIENFCHGIVLKGASTSDKVENNTIDNCTVHNNGVDGANCLNHGILLMYTANSTVSNNTVCNNTGEVVATCDTGGHGIRLYKYSNSNNVTNNTIYNNSAAGIFSKMICKYNNVTYNKVYENGKDVGGNTNYMGGGMRLECIHTNNWTVEYNTVTDNLGPGIFVRGKYNNVSHNDVTNNKNASSRATGTGVGVGYGIFFHSVGNNNDITHNRVCNNNGTDIYNNSDATNTFDENICYSSHPSGLCEYPCVYPYGHRVGNSPGANEPNEEFSRASIRLDDQVFQCNATNDNDEGYYAAHRFNFTVRESATKIDKIKVIWNGNGTHEDLDATDGAKLRIYNFNSAGYEQLDSTTLDTEVTLTGEKTSSISNYIRDHNVTVLVNQTSADGGEEAHSQVCTDLAKIVIYFKYP